MDTYHAQINVRGFKTDSLIERAEVIKSFMANNLKDAETYACIDTRMRGPWNAQTPSDASFVQLFTRQARDRVVKKVLDKNLAKDLKSVKGALLKVNRVRSDFMRGRDFAMGKPEVMIETKLRAENVNAEVKFVKAINAPQITTGGMGAFVQRRDDLNGHFVNDFASLRFP